VYTVKCRVYDTDSQGRRFLLHRPGDVITDAEAKLAAALIEPKPDKPAWTRIMARGKLLTCMTVAELRATCEVEGIDPAGAITRSDYVAVIGAAMDQRMDQRNEVER